MARTKAPVRLFVESKLVENPQVTNKELLETAIAAGHKCNMKLVYNTRYRIYKENSRSKIVAGDTVIQKHRKIKKVRKYTRRQKPTVSIDGDFNKMVASLGLTKSRELLKEFESKIGL